MPMPTSFDEQILILNSSQQALQMIAQLLIDPQDKVWLEELGNLSARNTMLTAGTEIVPVPFDAKEFNTTLRQNLSPPKLIYTTPSHQYPLGLAMSLSRRMTLLAQADQSSTAHGLLRMITTASFTTTSARSPRYMR